MALSTPYCPLKIQAARNAVTVDGSTHGNSDTARTKARPLNVWFIMSAHASAMTNVAAVAVTTKISVFSHTIAIFGSLSNLTKLSSPTNSGSDIWSV